MLTLSDTLAINIQCNVTVASATAHYKLVLLYSLCYDAVLCYEVLIVLLVTLYVITKDILPLLLASIIDAHQHAQCV